MLIDAPRCLHCTKSIDSMDVVNFARGPTRNPRRGAWAGPPHPPSCWSASKYLQSIDAPWTTTECCCVPGEWRVVRGGDPIISRGRPNARAGGNGRAAVAGRRPSQRTRGYEECDTAGTADWSPTPRRRRRFDADGELATHGIWTHTEARAGGRRRSAGDPLTDSLSHSRKHGGSTRLGVGGNGGCREGEFVFSRLARVTAETPDRHRGGGG